jgi:hypothetical protein
MLSLTVDLEEQLHDVLDASMWPAIESLGLTHVPRLIPGLVPSARRQVQGSLILQLAQPRAKAWTRADVVVEIAYHLDPASLLNFMVVCKPWLHAVVDCQRLWLFVCTTALRGSQVTIASDARETPAQCRQLVVEELKQRWKRRLSAAQQATSVRRNRDFCRGKSAAEIRRIAPPTTSSTSSTREKKKKIK